MRKITLIIVIALGALISSGIFYACKKDNELQTNADKAKVTKNGALENPFKLSGIVHNAALSVIVENPECLNMTGEEMWETMKPTFEAYFGADYVHAPYDMVNATYLESKALLEAKNTRSLIAELGDKGALNKDFTSDAITRNNYTILYNYWALLDERNIDFPRQLELTLAIEQEIIANYYSLLKHGKMQIAENDALYMEYKWVLEVVSIGSHSAMYWAACPSVPNEGYILYAWEQMAASEDSWAAFHDMREQMNNDGFFNERQNVAASAAASANYYLRSMPH